MSKQVTLLVICVLLFSNMDRLFSQETKSNVNAIVSGLNSRNMAKIEEAYNTLYPDDLNLRNQYRKDPHIKEAFWNAFVFLVPQPRLLSPKNKDVESPTLAMLMLSDMGQFKETRAIPYLLANIHDTGYALVLATMGESVVNPVLKYLANGDDPEKTGAAVALGQMLLDKSEPVLVTQWDPKEKKFKEYMKNIFSEDYEPTGEVRKKIKKALKIQLKMRSPIVKIHVLHAFSYVANEDDVADLEQIAKNDTYREKSTYFVREEAQKILDGMKAKKARSKPMAELQNSTSTIVRTSTEIINISLPQSTTAHQ